MNLIYGRYFWIPLKLGNTCIIGQTIRQKRRVSISQAMMGMTWACQVVRKERSFSNLQIRWGAKNTKGLGWFPIWGTKNPGQKKRGVGLENHMKNINHGFLAGWLLMEDSPFKRYKSDTETYTYPNLRRNGWCMVSLWKTARSVLRIHWILTYEDKFRLPRMRILTFT